MLTRYSLTQHADRFVLLFADALHLSPAPTEQLYDRQIRPIVHAAMSGYNGTCFAYGQTASGKTHTMMGSQTEPGVIPLAVDELFEFIRKVSASSPPPCHPAPPQPLTKC